MKNNTLKVVIFDLGDTLIYSSGSWQEIQNRSSKALWRELKRQGYSLNPETFIPTFSSEMRHYYQQREEDLHEYTSINVLRDSLIQAGFPDPDPARLRASINAMYAVSQQYWHLEEDAIETLNWLTEQDYRIGLISNASDTEDVFTLLKTNGLESYMELILVSAAFGLRKPHPAIFKEALDFFSVKPQHCMMVGDRLGSDILGANQVGIHSVWITRRADTPYNQKYSHITPSAEVSRLDEIPALLQN